MKTIICLCIFCGLGACFGETESEALAAGYAAAFANLGSSRASIVYVTESETEIIRDVKEVQAWGGVLAIRRMGAKREVLDPARIVRLSAE